MISRNNIIQLSLNIEKSSSSSNTTVKWHLAFYRYSKIYALAFSELYEDNVIISIKHVSSIYYSFVVCIGKI